MGFKDKVLLFVKPSSNSFARQLWDLKLLLVLFYHLPFSGLARQLWDLKVNAKKFNDILKTV